MIHKVLVIRRATAMGGAEKYLLNLIKSTRDRVSYHIITNLPEFSQELKSLGQSATIMNWAPEPFGRKNKLIFFARYLVDSWRFRRVVSSFAAAGGKAVYCQSLSDKFIVSPIALKYGLSVSWIEHGSIFGIIFGYTPLLKRYVELSRRLKAIICVSQAVADNVASIGVSKEKIVTIYNGTEPLKRSSGSGGPDLSLLVASRLSADKGHSYLLKALSQIKRSNWRLTIAGDGSERESLEAFARQLGLSSKVEFTGYRSDIKPLLADADIVVNPTINPSEGLGIINIEALAAGLPLISSWYGGSKETVVDGDTGLLVDPKNIDQLAEAIEKLISNPSLRQRFSANAVKLWEKSFSLEIMAARTIEVLVK